MILEFGEWLPDQPNAVSGIADVIDALPIASGYESGPGLSDLDYPVIPDSPLLVISENSLTFAFCKTKIYLFSNNTWNDVTRESSNYSANTTHWSAVRWGNFIYAVNGFDPIQKFDTTNLAGKFVDIPVYGGKSLAIVRDFLVIFSSLENSTPYPFRIHWSGRLRPEMFDPSLSTQAGFKDQPDIGEIIAGTGGEFGLILGSTGTTRIDYIGPPAVFSSNTIEKEFGCLTAKSVIKVGDSVYWWSKRGIVGYRGGAVQILSSEKVSRYLFNNLDLDQLNLISGIAFPDRPIIAWIYPSRDMIGGIPNQILYFNYELNRYSRGRSQNAVLLGTAAPAVQLIDTGAFGDSLIDIDTPTYLIDVDNNVSFICAVSSDRTIKAIKIGSSKCNFTTKEFNLETRSLVRRVRLICQGPIFNYRARVISREYGSTSEEVSFGPWSNMEKTGSIALNKKGRYHRVEISVDEGYTKFLGLDVDLVPYGVR